MMNGYRKSSSNRLDSFDPDSFKKELNRASVTVETLQVHRARIQAEADEINVKLKKNVFQNYSLFIESAREISLLKNEMYNLSRLLADQQSLMSSLTEISISGDRTHVSSEKKDVTPEPRGSESWNNVDISFDEVISESEVVPPWLQEVPDDLDVFIAQRNFEDAVSLVHKVNDHLILYPKCYDGYTQNDLRARVNQKIQELVECISSELKLSPDRSLQSGPRTARRAVHLLVRLGKTVMATKLFLDQRAAILRFSLKNQMKEGATLLFIKKMSSVFFNGIIESCREFDKAFKTSPNVATSGNKSPTTSFPVSFPMSNLISWAHRELKYFLRIFSKNVPNNLTSECTAIVREHANRVRNAVGLDILFLVDKHLGVFTNSDPNSVRHVSRVKIDGNSKSEVKMVTRC